MVPPAAAPGVLLIPRPDRPAVRAITSKEERMPEGTSGRKKTYLIIMVVLLAILAFTLI